MNRPLCFVLMPRGRKPDPDGALVDFDSVYHNLIAPAVHSAGLGPLRSVQDFSEDFHLKPLFEQFMLCPFAVVDLTLADANLYYELGARHAKRPLQRNVELRPQGRTRPRLSLSAQLTGRASFCRGLPGL